MLFMQGGKKMIFRIIFTIGQGITFITLLMCFVSVFLLTCEATSYPSEYAQWTWFVFICISDFWIVYNIGSKGVCGK
jgi:hypothetical protein